MTQPSTRHGRLHCELIRSLVVYTCSTMLLFRDEDQVADWRKKSITEARAIFAELGLTHPVWSLPSQAGRF